MRSRKSAAPPAARTGTRSKPARPRRRRAGRAGRRAERGEVFIQTYEPKHHLLNDIIKNNRDLFYEKELKIRKKKYTSTFFKIITDYYNLSKHKISRGKSKKYSTFI